MDQEQQKQEGIDLSVHAPLSPTPDEPTPAHTQATAHNSLVILGVLGVIIVVLALLFMWSSQAVTPVVVPSEPPLVVPMPTPEQEPTPEEAVSVLEAELDMPVIDTLDSELGTLEAELEAELEAIPAE